MIYYKAILKYEYYIRIMKTTIFKIVRLGAIRDFLVNKKGSIHDMLEHVNSKIHELDGESVGIRTIEKDLKKLKSEKNLPVMQLGKKEDVGVCVYYPHLPTLPPYSTYAWFCRPRSRVYHLSHNASTRSWWWRGEKNRRPNPFGCDGVHAP